MPLDYLQNLTDEERRKIITNRGLNPSEYDIDVETGYFKPLNTLQPTVSSLNVTAKPAPEPVIQTKQSSRFGATVRGFGSGFLPSAATIGTAALAAKMSLPLAAVPVVGPLIPPTIGFGAGLLASLGAQKGQEALMPESFKQQLSADVAEHPNYSLGGNIAGALPFLKPDPRAVIDAIKTVGKVGRNVVAQPIPVTGKEISNMINVGVGGATGAGESIYGDISTDQPINIPKALAVGGVGALLNNPTRIAQKYFGLQPNTPIEGRREEGLRAGMEPLIRKAGDENLAGYAENLVRAKQLTDLRDLVKETKTKKSTDETAAKTSELYSGKNVEGKYTVSTDNFLRALKETIPDLVTIKNKKLALAEGLNENTTREALDRYKHGDVVYETRATNLKESNKLLAEANKAEAELRTEDELASNRLALEARKLKTQQELKEFFDKTLDEQRFGDFTEAQKLTNLANEQKLRELQRLHREEGRKGKVPKELFPEELLQNPVRPNVKTRGKVAEHANIVKELNYKAFKEAHEKGDLALAGERQEEGFLPRLQAERRGEPSVPEPIQPVKQLGLLKNIPPAEDIVTGKKQKLETVPASKYGPARRTFFQEEGVSATTEPKKPALPNYPGAEVLETKVEASGKAPVLTKAIYDYVTKAFGPLRNVDFSLKAGLTTPDGKPLRGKLTYIMGQGVRKALAEINPFRARPDTIVHEPFHAFFRDMELHGSVSDKKLVTNLKNHIKQSPEFVKFNEDRIKAEVNPVDVSEFLTETANYDVVRRLWNTDNTGNFRNRWKDFWNAVKVKWGKATNDDYARLMADRFVNDPRFTDVFEPNILAKKVTVEEGEKEETFEAVKDSTQPDETSNSKGGDITNADEIKSQEEFKNTAPKTTEETPILKDAPVVYKGHQPGFGKIKGFHLYNLTETISPKLVKDSTVTEKSLKEAGFKIPDEIKAKEPIEKTAEEFMQPDEDKTPIVFKQSVKGFEDDKILITKSVKRPNKWQATLFRTDLETGEIYPVGDYEFFSKEDAIKSAQGEKTLNHNNPIGSKTFKRAPEEFFSADETRPKLSFQKPPETHFTESFENRNLSREFNKLSDSELKDEKQLNRFKELQTNDKIFYDEELKTLRDQDSVRSKLKEKLLERTYFKDVRVTKPLKTRSGQYDPASDKTSAEARQPDTAFHEVLHRTHFKNEGAIKKLTDQAINQNRLSYEDFLNAAKALKTISEHNYGYHLDKLESVKNTAGFNSSRKKELFFDVTTEAAAQITSGEKYNALNKLTKEIFGPEYYNFIANAEKDPRIFPFYRPFKSSTNEKLYNSLTDDKTNLYNQRQKIQNKLEERNLAEKYYDNELDFVSFKPKENASEAVKQIIRIYDNLGKQVRTKEKQITSLLSKDRGEYYQSAEGDTLPVQGTTVEDIARNFDFMREAPEFKGQNIFVRNFKEFSSRLPIIGSDLDKLEVRGGPSGEYISPKLRESFELERTNEGKYLNPTLDILRPLNTKDLELLYATGLAELRSKTSLKESLPLDLQESFTKLREVLRQKQLDQIEANQPVISINKEGKPFYRLPEIDKFYWPQIAGAKQIDILINQQNSSAFTKLKNEFINLQKDKYGLNDVQANTAFEDMIGSYGGPIKGDSTRFGAVRRAEGIGLPDSWLEPDLGVALRRYWRRVSKDRAFHDAVESDNDALYILGRSKNPWGKPVTKPDNAELLVSNNETLTGILNSIQGHNVKINPRLDAGARIATNSILGFITGANDFISAVPLLAKFIPRVQDIPGALAAGLNIAKGIKHAKQTGLIKENISSYEDIFTPSSEIVERLRSFANFINKISGREIFEKWGRGLSQVVAENLIGVHKGLAETGNVKSLKLLEGLANKKNWRDLTTEDLATRMAEISQGTYDVRGLPSWVIDSQIAPILRLSKWSIEQLNNLHKHVILPAIKDGNYTPLFMTLGGGLIGGYIAKEVREQLSGKPTNVPFLSEIAAADDGEKLPAYAYNIAAAISYSGITGILGDLIKSGLAVRHGDLPQGFNYPLIEVIGNVTTDILNASNAIIEHKENPVEVLPKLIAEIFTNNAQVARVAINWAEKYTTEGERISQRRSLKVFKQLHGLPTAPAYLGKETFQNLEERKFKRLGEENLGQIKPELTKLLNKAIVKAKEDDNFNIVNYLQGLKRIPTSTFPSPEASPKEFVKFKTFQEKTLGRLESDERLRKYLTQREINRVKAKLVP